MTAVISDFALLSILFVVSHVLRARLAILRVLFLPTPIIAGFLALLLGRQGVDLIPFNPPGEGAVSIADYPSVLVTLLFATLLMGARTRHLTFRSVLRRSGDTFFYNLAAECGQYGFALLFGFLVLGSLFPSVDAGFPLLLPAGFVGGHGTATAIAGVLRDNGWEEAMTVGYTFATVGLLSGVVGGVLLINIGTRAGWTRLVRSADRKARIAAEAAPGSRRRKMVSTVLLDTLTWHVALVLVAYALARGAQNVAGQLLPAGFQLPLFVLAMLAGALVQKLLDVIRLGDRVDRSLMARLGTLFSDYLVAFGIASIEIPVVIEYGEAICVFSAVGVAYSIGMLWFVGRRLFRTYWFERSLFVYGWNTGVVAIGVALLGVVDPRHESDTLEDFGVAYFFISFAALSIITILPQLVIRGQIALPSLGLCLVFAASILLSRRLIGWFRLRPECPREGERVAGEKTESVGEQR